METAIVLVYFLMLLLPAAVVAVFLDLVRRDGGAALPASDVYRLPADGTENLEA